MCRISVKIHVSVKPSAKTSQFNQRADGRWFARLTQFIAKSKMATHTQNFGIRIAALSILLINVAPSTAAFKQLDITAMTPCDYQLTQIAHIPYQCWQFQDGGATLAVWANSIGFSFGKLSEDEWYQIAQAYGQGNPMISYNPDQDYWLMDFMPPLMQATNRHRFESEIRTLPNLTSSSKETTILANCWGTLYELLRLKQASVKSDSFLMMVDPSEMLATLKSVSIPVEQPQFGDFVLITHRHGDRIYFDHGAFYVDNRLLFEKAGAGDSVPYRLIDLGTLQRIWRSDVFDYQIRRPVANRRLPHPLSFGVKDPQRQQKHNPWTVIEHDNDQPPHQQYYLIYPLPQLVETQGRFNFKPEVYTSDYYQGKLD